MLANAALPGWSFFWRAREPPWSSGKWELYHSSVRWPSPPGDGLADMAEQQLWVLIKTDSRGYNDSARCLDIFGGSQRINHLHHCIYCEEHAGKSQKNSWKFWDFLKFNFWNNLWRQSYVISEFIVQHIVGLFNCRGCRTGRVPNS